MKKVVTRTDAHLELNAFRRKQDCALVISGESLEICLSYYQQEFMELATAAPAVVCCRCSPTQKAQVVSLFYIIDIIYLLMQKKAKTLIEDVGALILNYFVCFVFFS